MEIFTKNFLDKSVDMVLDWLSQHGVDIILIIILGIASYYIGSWLMNKLTKTIIVAAKRSGWTKADIKKRQKTVSSMTVAIWKVAVFLFSGISILREITPNINFATIIASLGAVSVMISLGAQSLIRDFLNGIFVISENQYRVGDVIEIDGYTGSVSYVGARTTVIRDSDGNVHYFPNGTITHVINKTMTYSMSRFKIKISLNSNLDEAIKIINKIGKNMASDPEWSEKIINAPHFESVTAIDNGSMEIVISGKTGPSYQWEVSSQMRQRIVQQFSKYNIELA